MPETRHFSPFPPSDPFPESQRSSTGTGLPDFPGSAGDRELGKFRPSRTPRLDTIAVVNDDGTVVGSRDATLDEEMVFLLRGILYAMSELLETMSVDYLLNEGNKG